jgi:hypothetical protein
VVPGPVDVAVISFEGDRFKSEIAPALAQVVERGIVRIVDVLFIAKDEAGNVRTFELDDAEVELADTMWLLADEVSGLLSEDDIAEIGERIEPSSSAAMVVFEHTWLRQLREAILNANGRLVTQERVPAEIVERALAARAGA